MNTNPCKCVDCGGSEPGHSNDCTYMLELHGDVVRTPVPSQDDLLVWPDGTQCHRNELSQMTHMSDDYQVLYYGTPEYYAEMLS